MRRMFFSLDIYWLIFIICVLFVCRNVLLMCVRVRVRDSAVDFQRQGKEFQSGQHQRNVFYFSLMIASSFKFVMMMLEVRYFSNETCAFSHVCSFLRFAPDLLFLAAYAIMIVFLTQLGYDVAGVSSAAPKNTFVTCFFVSVILFFPCMIFEPRDDPNLYLFRFLGIVHLLMLVVIIYSGMVKSALN